MRFTEKLTFEADKDTSDKKEEFHEERFKSSSEEELLGQFTDKKKSGKASYKNNKKAFLNTADLFYGMTKPEDNEAAASNIDEKIVSILTYKERIALDKAAALKKDGKENKVQIRKESEVFRTEYEFSDKAKQFKNPFERFRLLRKDTFGNDIFLPKRKDNAITVLMLQGRSENEKNITNSNAVVKNQISDRFGISSIKESDGKKNKSVNSYFDNDNEKKKEKGQQKKFVTNEERYEKANEQRKIVKKEYSEEVKKAARLASVANLFRAKKIVQNDLANVSGGISGDALKDGAGTLKVITEAFIAAIKQQVKRIIISAIAAFLGFVASVISAIAPLIVIIIIILVVLTSFFSIFTDGIEVPSGDGYTYASLTDDEVDEIITLLYETYPDMSNEQLTIVNYVLSKVGCDYDQDYHWSLTQDIFDCSSLAYRTYLEVGYDISNQGIFSASEECRTVVNGNYIVTDELQPGDLIFYGGADNGRYMGVYHVAIYVGNGKMVEARGTSWGVVYCDARTDNAVVYGRYL